MLAKGIHDSKGYKANETVRKGGKRFCLLKTEAEAHKGTVKPEEGAGMENQQRVI